MIFAEPYGHRSQNRYCATLKYGSVEPLLYSMPSDDYASRACRGQEKKVPAITTTLKKREFIEQLSKLFDW